MSVHELLRVRAVGRKKEIGGSAIPNLLGECGGGAKSGQDPGARLPLVVGSKGGQNRLEVGRCRDMECSVLNLGLAAVTRKCKCQGEEKAAK